jgi:hypothetical protein
MSLPMSENAVFSFLRGFAERCYVCLEFSMSGAFCNQTS